MATAHAALREATLVSSIVADESVDSQVNQERAKHANLETTYDNYTRMRHAFCRSSTFNAPRHIPIYILTSIHSQDRVSMPRSSQATMQDAALRGLRTIIAVLSRSARAIEARTGVTNAQLFILQQLQADEALGINDLAARARTGQSAVSIVVRRLVRRGLVHRRRLVADGRRVGVSLTVAGRALVCQAPEPPTTRLLAAVGGLDYEDLRALARGVTALVPAMGVAGETPPMLFEGDGSRRRPARPRDR
jgi:DNA-binding MarR family transcriptional regulator